ncbi:MAG: sigma-54 dependent transcriptional regulator [Methylococcales bacterium]
MESFSTPNFSTFNENSPAKVLDIGEVLLRSVSRPDKATALVFEDPASKQLLAQIERIAAGNSSVLILGDSGTGKALVAKHIHALSKRSKQIFGALNCSALHENLIENELFGYEKGAFAGAVNHNEGWLHKTHKGTLFLDEISDLPLAIQDKLLRAVQQHEVMKVGGRQATPVDVRIIAATQVNLEVAVAAGQFRADLFYRFNIATIHLKPLRHRPGDILPLARHFIKIYAQRFGVAEVKLLPSSELLLLNHDWPGNIGELENAVHRALLICNDQCLRPEDFKLSAIHNPDQHSPISTSALERALQGLYAHSPPKLFELIEEASIRTAFEFCAENQVKTARLLNISRNVLRHKLEVYGLLPIVQKKMSGS